MKVSLKAWNLPRLLIVWVLNVAVFSGVLTGAVDIQNIDVLRALLTEVAEEPEAGWPFAGLVTVITIFNGAIPRSVKERLVFWPAPRPGSRAFSHFMLKDSTINRSLLREHFDPLPSLPDEQNALWAGWLHEFENDARVRPTYGLYLFARDWTAIALATWMLATPLAIVFAENVSQALWYCAVLLVQFAFARWLARVQGEQLVMSVMASKATSMRG